MRKHKEGYTNKGQVADIKEKKGHLMALGQWRTTGKVTLECGIKST